jgi:hypothetical protein
MKKLFASIVAVASVLAGSFAFSSALPVFAYSPTLNIYSSGVSNGYVTLSVSNAQPNSTVSVYYYNSSNANQAILAGSFGTTDYNGSFSIQEPWGNDSQSGITGRYAKIGGIITNTVSAYSYSSGYNGGTGGNNGTLTFSNNNPTVAIGQTTSVTLYTASNYYSSSYYISSNSNSNIASASISGSMLQLYGLASGSTSLTICSSSSSYGYGNQCGTIYVTVSGSTYGTGSVTFAQSSVSLTSGQTLSDTIYNTGNYYSSSYYISGNTNSAAVSATISGSTIQLYALAAGSATITVCSTSSSYGYGTTCGTVYVTVSGSTYGTGSVTFAESTVSLTSGQTYSDALYNISGTYGTYYVSSNSNSSVASATISGSTLQLYGYNSGTTNIVVCSSAVSYNYNNSCGTVYVTVNGSGYSTGTITAYPSNPYLSYGQSLNVTLSQTVYNGYASGAFYINSNTNPSAVSATISGNTLSLYGANYGTAVISVCGSNSYSNVLNSCLPITVTVNNSSSGNGYGTVTFSNANPTLIVGQTTVVNVYSTNSLYGANTSFYLASNSNASVASETFSGSTVQISAISAGSTVMQFCTSSSSIVSSPACGYLYVTVTSNGQVLGASTYRNGQLIQEGQQISIVYRNEKTAFANYSAFVGLGFKLYNVLNVGSSNLTNSYHVVTTQYAAHPWGTWIQNGSTIYFVSEYGLIPVPDYGTFLNNGGQSAWVVPSNVYDMQLPMQSNMSYNDSRLQ